MLHIKLWFSKKKNDILICTKSFSSLYNVDSSTRNSYLSKDLNLILQLPRAITYHPQSCNAKSGCWGEPICKLEIGEPGARNLTFKSGAKG